MLRTLAVATTLTAAVLLAAPAHADQSGFLNEVHAAGIPLTDQKALVLGQATCTDLSNGIDMSAILASNNPGVGNGPRMTSAQNWALFSAAVSELCPQMQSGY